MKILDTLTKYLEWEVKRLITSRYDSFLRQLDFLKSQENKYLMKIYSLGWNDEKLRVIFAFNSFYQIVLGPLTSSSKLISKTNIGGKIPIIYGSSIKFDLSRNNNVNRAHEDFTKILNISGIKMWLLTLSSTNDIIYNIQKDAMHDQ